MKERVRKKGLNKFTNSIYFLEQDPEVDRPMLAYLKGDKFSLVIDAGYLASHVQDFYRAIEAEQFNKPDFLYGFLAFRRYRLHLCTGRKSSVFRGFHQ